MNKTPLPVRVESGDMIYQLIYIPGLPATADPRYCVPPPAKDWHPISGGMREVDVPNGGKQYLGWIVMQQPSIMGTATPPRNYLFLYLRKLPFVQQAMDPQTNMICYAMTPRETQADPIQSFVNRLFGAPVVPEAEKSADWVQDLFSLPETPPAETEDSGAMA